MEPFCRAIDRTDTRSREASLLITEAFRSVGLYHLVVGRAKIRAEVKKARKKAEAAAAKNNLLKCLSFDGKRNKTLKTLPGTSTNRIEDEEQVVLVKEPGSQYMGYVLCVIIPTLAWLNPVYLVYRFLSKSSINPV